MKKIGLFLSTALIGALVAGSAQATLIARDLNAVGDALLTLDSATNFEWLDPSQSLNRSLNDLTGVDGTNDFADPSSPFFGFRYATSAEIFTSFDNGGVRPGSEGTTDADVFVLASDLSNADFLAFRDLVFDGEVGVAMFASSAATNGYAEIAFIAATPERIRRGDVIPAVPAMNRATIDTSLNFIFTDGSISDPGTGSFLLRTAVTVPEPSSVLLLCIGLGGLVAMRRRQRRDKGVIPNDK